MILGDIYFEFSDSIMHLVNEINSLLHRTVKIDGKGEPRTEEANQ